jgi:hypothetical protein
LALVLVPTLEKNLVRGKRLALRLVVSLEKRLELLKAVEMDGAVLGEIVGAVEMVGEMDGTVVGEMVGVMLGKLVGAGVSPDTPDALYASHDICIRAICWKTFEVRKDPVFQGGIFLVFAHIYTVLTSGVNSNTPQLS